MKHVVIAGAGVVGVVNAYFLLNAGYKVTLIERHEAASSEASGANVSCLHTKYIHPKGEPTLLPQIPSILLGGKPLLKIRALYKPSHFWWSLRLLFESFPVPAEKNQNQLNEFAQISNKIREEMAISHSISCDLMKKGKLLTHESQTSYNHARNQFTKYFGEDDQDIDFLNAAQLIEKEPVLAHLEDKIAGAIYLKSDHFADCQLYTRHLLHHLQDNYGDKLDIRFDTAIKGFEHKNGLVQAVKTEQGDTEDEIRGDIFILSAGIGTKALARSLGVKLPMMPAKGYTLCLPYKQADNRLNANMTYTAKNLVIAPYNDRIRLSSGFFIGEGDYTIRNDKLDIIREYASYVLPDLDFSEETIYMGHRPCIPNSLPLNEMLKGFDNVVLNTGHGMFGWSLAHYSGQKVTGIVKNAL